MTYREIQVPAGNRRVIEFSTSYSQSWSVEAKRGVAIESAEVENAVFILKRKLTDPDDDANVTKELADGIAVTSGKATVTLDATDTKDLQGKYFGTLRLFLTDSGVVDWMDQDYANAPYIMLDFTQGAVETVV